MTAAKRRSLIALALAGVIGLAVVAGVIIAGLGDKAVPGDQAETNVAGSRPSATADRPPGKQSPADESPPALPVRDLGQPPGTIRLPQGGTAELVHQEVDSSGTLPIPDGVGEATWWGSGIDAVNGATVLAGHVNWDGAVGPFAELWDSKPGQVVTVTGDHRETSRYEISEVVTVDKTELPSRAPELFGQGGPHRLVLVTCGGRFVGGDTGYDENRIVIATPSA